MNIQHLIPCLTLLSSCSVPYETDLLAPEEQQHIVSTSNALDQVTCAVQTDNALRFDCEIATTIDANVYIEVMSDDGEHLFSTQPTTGQNHEHTLWGLRTDTRYQYAISIQTDETNELVGNYTLTTEYDEVLSRVSLQTNGAHVETDMYTIIPTTCNEEVLVIILDNDNQIVWYEDLSAYGEHVAAIEATANNTIIAVIDNIHLLEFTLAGELINHITETDVGHLIHHEIQKVGNNFIAITAEKITDPYNNKTYILDSIRTFDTAGNTIASVRSDEIFNLYGEQWKNDPGYFGSEYENGFYAFQANSFDIDDNGDIVVGFKTIDTIIKINGDATSQNYGDVLWLMSGGQGGDMIKQSTFGINTSFSGQHNVNISNSGSLMIFDNMSHSNSRVIEFDLNETAHQANAINEYFMDSQCSVGGSAIRLGSATVGVCGNINMVTEFDHEGYSTWNLNLECAHSDARPLYRALPVSTLWQSL